MLPATAAPALAGGLIIGLASAIMLLVLGRIAGVSGLTAGALRLSGSKPDWPVALAFIAGLPLGALLVQDFVGIEPVHYPRPAVLVAAGLLVGFGTRLGGGCTSGHGVCGISRLSFRSVVATAIFIAAGIVTVALGHM